MGQILVLNPGSHYIIPSGKGFSEDMRLLQGDARRVASDLNRVTKKYGKQAYNRKGKQR